MFKKVTEDAILPTRGSKYAACVDVYANEDVVIEAGETKLVGLGVSIDLEKIYKNWFFMTEQEVGSTASWNHFLESHYLQLSLRSSLGKKGLIMPHGIGVVDLDYKDEIKMIIHNPICAVYQDFEDDVFSFKLLETHNYSAANKEVRYTINKNDKIGQITLLEHKSYLFGIDTDEERVGGFGSTGV